MRIEIMPRAADLSNLQDVELSGRNQTVWGAAREGCGGPLVWKNRKLAEAHDLLALSQLASRLRVDFLDLNQTLRAIIVLRAPAPSLPPSQPPGQQELQIASEVVLAISYREEAIRQQLPGYSFMQILSPQHVWHANVAHDSVQPLCLGDRLPAGIRVKELVLMAYGALTMQTVQIDELDSAGVMNAQAARWWQGNLHRVPLSAAPFLSPID